MDKEQTLEERIAALEEAMANIQQLGVTSEVTAAQVDSFLIELAKRAQKLGSSNAS